MTVVVGVETFGEGTFGVGATSVGEGISGGVGFSVAEVYSGVAGEGRCSDAEVYSGAVASSGVVSCLIVTELGPLAGPHQPGSGVLSEVTSVGIPLEIVRPVAVVVVVVVTIVVVVVVMADCNGVVIYYGEVICHGEVVHPDPDGEEVIYSEEGSGSYS